MSNHEPIVALEKKVRHLNGHSVYLEMNGYPWLDEEGSFLGYRGVDRDITEHKISKRTIEEGRKKLDVATAEAMARRPHQDGKGSLEEFRDSLREGGLHTCPECDRAKGRRTGLRPPRNRRRPGTPYLLRENELQQVSASWMQRMKNWPSSAQLRHCSKTRQNSRPNLLDFMRNWRK